MKLWLLPLTMFALLAILWRDVMPAAACSGGFSSLEEAREAIVNDIDLLLIGAVAEPSGEYVEIEVETTFKGAVSQRITLNQSSKLIGTYASFQPPVFGDIDPGCGYTVRGDPGERYFLVLEQSQSLPGAYDAKVFSFAMREARLVDNPIYGAALTLPAGGGLPTSGRSALSIPAPAILVLGLVGTFAGAAILWQRGRSVNG